MWILSKTGSEFFTGSSDGTVGVTEATHLFLDVGLYQVLWWDIRKFTTPVERLVLDPFAEEGSTARVRRVCR